VMMLVAYVLARWGLIVVLLGDNGLLPLTQPWTRTLRAVVAISLLLAVPTTLGAFVGLAVLRFSQRRPTQWIGVVGCALVWVALVVIAFWNFAQQEKAWEHPVIVRRLTSLRGASLVAANLSSGNLGWTYARLRIGESGSLRLTGLTLDSFRSGSPLHVEAVGDNWPRIVSYGYGYTTGPDGRPTRSVGLGHPLDVSDQSPFRGISPIHSKSVQEAIDRYDDLLTFVNSWPLCPDSAALRGRDGTEYRYCSQKGSTDQIRFGKLTYPRYPKEWNGF